MRLLLPFAFCPMPFRSSFSAWLGLLISVALTTSVGAQIGSGALAGDVVDQAVRRRFRRCGHRGRGRNQPLAHGRHQLSRTVVTVNGLLRSGPRAWRLSRSCRVERVPAAHRATAFALATGETVRLDLQLRARRADRSASPSRPMRRCCAATPPDSATSSTTGRSSTCRSTAGASSRSRASCPAWRCRRRRPLRCRASTAAGRAPTSTCSTASRCCSPSRARSRSSRTSTRSRSSRSKATARPPSSAASTAASST